MAINATDQTFNDYKDVLDKNDIPDGTARAETKLSDYKGKGLARWNKKCVLLQQE